MSGLPITGDLDLALITQAKGIRSKMIRTPLHGIESQFEKSVREEINTVYHSRIKRGALSQKKILNNLVNHGPEVRNPCHQPPDYPWMDSSGFEIVQGPPTDPHQNLRDYLKKLKKQGAYFDLPRHWKPHLESQNDSQPESRLN